MLNIFYILHNFRSTYRRRKRNPGRKITMSKDFLRGLPAIGYDFSRCPKEGEETDRTRKVLFVPDAFSA